MASKPKTQPKVQKQIQVQKQQVRQEASSGLLPLETQEKIVVRYGVSLGISIINKKKRERASPYTAEKKRLLKEKRELIEGLIEGKYSKEYVMKKVKEINEKIERVDKERKKITEPFNKILRPLNQTLKNLDRQIENDIKRSGKLTIIGNIIYVPPQYRPEQYRNLPYHPLGSK